MEPECSSTNRSSGDRSTVDKSSEARSSIEKSIEEIKEEGQKEVVVAKELSEKSTGVEMGMYAKDNTVS